MGARLGALIPLALAVLIGPAFVQAQEREVGENYLHRLIKVWEEDASRTDLEALGALLSEDVVYEHPGIGARIEGRSSILEAMSAFLGSSRGPRASGVEFIVGAGVVTLGFDLMMEQRQETGWSLIERRQVIVLQIDEGRIIRISDHW